LGGKYDGVSFGVKGVYAMVWGGGKVEGLWGGRGNEKKREFATKR